MCDNLDFRIRLLGLSFVCLLSVGCGGEAPTDPMELMHPDPRVAVANFLEVHSGDRPWTDTSRMHEAMDVMEHRYPGDYTGLANRIDRALDVHKRSERERELRSIAAELRAAAASKAASATVPVNGPGEAEAD